MTYLLRKCNEAKESLKTQKIKNHEFGKDGPNMQNRLDSAKIFGSPLCSQSNTLTLLPPLLPPCTEDNFLDHMTKTWLCQQYKRPWQNWVRSLGQTWGTTPHTWMQIKLFAPITYQAISRQWCHPWDRID